MGGTQDRDFVLSVLLRSETRSVHVARSKKSHLLRPEIPPKIVQQRLRGISSGNHWIAAGGERGGRPRFQGNGFFVGSSSRGLVVLCGLDISVQTMLPKDREIGRNSEDSF